MVEQSNGGLMCWQTKKFWPIARSFTCFLCKKIHVFCRFLTTNANLARFCKIMVFLPESWSERKILGRYFHQKNFFTHLLLRQLILSVLLFMKIGFTWGVGFLFGNCPWDVELRCRLIVACPNTGKRGHQR